MAHLCPAVGCARGDRAGGREPGVRGRLGPADGRRRHQDGPSQVRGSGTGPRSALRTSSSGSRFGGTRRRRSVEPRTLSATTTGRHAATARRSGSSRSSRARSRPSGPRSSRTPRWSKRSVPPPARRYAAQSQASAIAATWRWSVPQQPPTTFTFGRRVPHPFEQRDGLSVRLRQVAGVAGELRAPVGVRAPGRRVEDGREAALGGERDVGLEVPAQFRPSTPTRRGVGRSRSRETRCRGGTEESSPSHRR
jgi:hypothetical protein